MQTARSTSDVYLQRYRRDQIERDHNKLLIGMAAIEDLRQVKADEDQDNNVKLDNDWLNEYVDIAGRKSCRDIQLLWGRLLAGEIRTPGTYSLRTLHRLSVIDSNEAIKIHNFLLYSLSNKFVLRDPSIDALDFNSVLEMEDLDIASVSGGMLNTDVHLL